MNLHYSVISAYTYVDKCCVVFRNMMECYLWNVTYVHLENQLNYDYVRIDMLLSRSTVKYNYSGVAVMYACICL